VLNRSEILKLTEASLGANRPDYARKLARAWLQSWPGDFAVNLLLARALSAEADLADALEILNKLAIIDPESAEVNQVIATVAERTGDTKLHEDSDSLSRVLLGGSLPRVPWMVAARESINAIERRQWEPARQASERAVQANPDILLPSLLLLKSHWLAGHTEFAFPLAQGFFDRWPQCVALTLCLAEALLRAGDHARGVELLHNVVVLDPAGELVDRYWGGDHVYRPIWPPEPRVQQVAPIPPEIATRLGINRLEPHGNGRPADSEKECNCGCKTSDANPNNNESKRFASNSHIPDVEITESAEANTLLTSETQIHRIEEGSPLDRPPADSEKECNCGCKTSDANPKNNESTRFASNSQLPDMEITESAEANTLLTSETEIPGIQEGNPLDRPPAAQAVPETLHDVQAELERVRRQLDAVSPNRHVNGSRLHLRDPGTHIIITCARALVEKYGTREAERVLTLTRLLAESTAKNADIPCAVVLLDVADSLAPFRLGPIDGRDPIAIKGLINDLSAFFQRDGKCIGSMLLIGGDDIIPFFRLPNPTDDHDADVPSDNPYGTGDDNYFVPEWPVGRLPGPCGREASALIHLIQNTIRAHGCSTPQSPMLVRWLRWLFPTWQPGASGQHNFGYSADIWRDASLEVFHAIGRTRDLVTSPPLQADNMSAGMLARATDFLYCNLHGLEDAAAWYGESASLNGEVPTYPIALRPSDIDNGNAPAVVFTEACYGANIVDKHTPQAAMCLQFLQAGSKSVVGSTRIAYGAVGAPLIGADLLGRFFWHYMLRGIPVGESLRRSRMGLAQTMDSRQGFLDGEDQKALISFVLYGDPLLRGPKMLPPVAKSTAKSIAVPVAEIRATCAKSGKACAQALGHPAALSQVKALVSQYLPGMENAAVNVHRLHLQCEDGDHECLARLAPHAAMQKTLSFDSDQLVYSLSRKVRVNEYQKHQYAHVTVSKAGKVVKLAVSR